MRYLDRLIQSCTLAKTVKAVEQFTLLNTDDLTRLKDYHGQSVIYTIELIDADEYLLFEQLKAFYREQKQLKASGQAYFCGPRPNQAAKILYVGSSRTSIYQRIRQHLGVHSPKTHALHLDQFSNAQVKIRFYIYPTLEPLILQLIEDDLSDLLQPAFGKQGANNK